MKLIGGHLNMEVYLTDEDTILKKALDVGNESDLNNEYRFLKMLDGEGIAPKALKKSKKTLTQEKVSGWCLRDADDSKEVVIEDGENIRRNCIRLLDILRHYRIRHGDLTTPNICVTPEDNVIAIDWQQSHLFNEPFPDRKTSDSFLLWRTFSGIPSKNHPTPDTPRIIRRWMAVMSDLGGDEGVDNLEGRTLLDLGCFLGDFCAMAAADGMTTTGIDIGGFNTDFDSIARGAMLWGGMHNTPKLGHADIMTIQDQEFDKHEIVLLFSTWSYIVNEYGKEEASNLLSSLVKNDRILYFENQLFGDGPGPDFFQSDTDIQDFLKKFGNVKKLVTVPVTGRPAFRSVWSVR